MSNFKRRKYLTDGDVLMMWQYDENGHPKCTSLRVTIDADGVMRLQGKAGAWLLAPMTYNPRPGEIPEKLQ